MKTTPRAPVPTQVTTAAKRPEKTKFLADISAALDIFDDEISSVGDCHAMAYETFVLSYRTAFAHIWLKIKTADVKTVLQSVKDKEWNELCRMSQMMSSDSSKPALIKENRAVPTLENILANYFFLVSSSSWAGCLLLCLLVLSFRGVRLFWGMFVRGCARHDLC